MRALALSLIAGLAGGAVAAFAQWGDLPISWAKHGHSHTTRNASGDVLYDLTGCRLLGEVYNGKSFQCSEIFVYVGPNGKADLALGLISNFQVEGYLEEARVLTMNALTKGNGRIDRAVADFTCGGNVGQCILRFSNGWEIRPVEDRLELFGPDGTLRDVWR